MSNDLSREIKFRAWHGVDMHAVELLSWDKQGNLEGIGFVDGRIKHISECKVMQFTGLKDRAGTEIFEGAIVEEGDLRGVIEYDKDYACYLYRTKTSTVKLYLFAGKIIGNIHENPELAAAK